MGICEQSAVELLGALERRELSSRELVGACLDRMERHEPAIHAFSYYDRDEALASAEAIDQRRARGEPLGPLAGLPVALKANLCVRGSVTSCGSRMLAEFVPPYDATVVARLRAADAVLLGSTNMDEFAMGSSTENSALGPTANPWDVSRIPGGSSGGSAASVAARMIPLAVGSDTGGSIRQPAALCGVVGLKPTYGRVSRYGLVAFASSLDQIGPLARTAEDAALLLEVVAGHDPADSTSAPRAVEPYREWARRPLEGLRLGVLRGQLGQGLDDQLAEGVRQAVEVYQGLGARLVDVELPHSHYGIATYYVLAPCEASSNLARYEGAHYGYRVSEDELAADLAAEQERVQQAGGNPEEIDSALVRMYCLSRSQGFGAEVKRRIMLGTYALSAGYYDAYYLKALKVRRLIRQDYDQAFSDVDLLIGPVTASAAFPRGEKLDDPLAMYLEDLFTVTANLAGVPGVSVPCGFTSQGLPIGFQLQGPPFAEARLLQAAAAYQRETDWHLRSPDLG